MSAAPSLACIVALSLLLWSGVAHSHHSVAVYDSDKQIELRGTIVDFKLRNPHASFVVDARRFVDNEPRGDVERWEIESQSPAMLRTLGIDPQTFEAGDPITIVAWPHRNPSFRFAHSVALVDAFGAEYVMANSDRIFSPSLRAVVGGEPQRVPESAARAPDAGVAKLVGRWQQPLIAFGEDGPNLPLNEAGMAAWLGYGPKLSPANTCEPKNVPDMFFAPFFLFELRVDARQAVLHSEEYDTVRTVPLDGTVAVADARGGFGSVRGRIEDDALVVESRGYPVSRWGLGVEEAHGGRDVPSSAAKTVIERFSVTPDGRTLLYEYTLADPTYMTGPHRGRVELTRVPDGIQMYGSDCDLESASMWSRAAGDAPLRVGPQP